MKQKPKLEFPDFNSYPYHIREIFELFNGIVTKDDLIGFQEKTLYSDNIINLYFKILEKVNLVNRNSYNFRRATVRNTTDLYRDTKEERPFNYSKILYYTTSFTKKLEND